MSGEIIYPYFLYRYVREWWNIYSFSIQNIRQFDAAFAGEQEPSRAAARVPRKTQEGREAFACRRLTMPDKRPGGSLRRRQLNDDEVHDIRSAEGKGSGAKMAKKYRMSEAAISKIRRRLLYRVSTTELLGKQQC